MVKIGLVDVTTSHADAFSNIFNIKKEFRGFRVTKCWDVDQKRSKEVADLYGLESVDSLAKMTDIDAVMVLSRDQNKHLEYARPFLKKGLPTFVDKTTTQTLRQAISMYSLAKKHKAPIFSASALRFAKELEEARKVMDKMGKIRFINAQGPGELMFYGQHVFDAVQALVGPGIKTVQNIGTDKIAILKLECKGGLTVQIVISDFGHVPFQFHVADKETCHSFKVTDGAYFYWNMMKAFVQMVKTGKAPFDGRGTLEIIDGMCKGVSSLEKGGKVMKVAGKYKI